MSEVSAVRFISSCDDVLEHGLKFGIGGMSLEQRVDEDVLGHALLLVQFVVAGHHLRQALVLQFGQHAATS